MPISTRALMIITIVVLVAVAAVVAWWVTRESPLVPVDVPSVSVA